MVIIIVGGGTLVIIKQLLDGKVDGQLSDGGVTGDWMAASGTRGQQQCQGVGFIFIYIIIAVVSILILLLSGGGGGGGPLEETLLAEGVTTRAYPHWRLETFQTDGTLKMFNLH